MHNYKDLLIWQKSMNLVKEVYSLTETFPENEKCGLTQQIRRSAMSIPSNIAEGCGRGSDKQLVQFLGIALGSCYELETQIILAGNVITLLDQNSKILDELIEVQKMIHGFIKKINSDRDVLISNV